ncbi:MAG: PLDc_N domain-containing protein [Solirubrobacteraceae bacterium]|nr:PLDc_N domain-containing protein [Solirubrobacteraceae bacterium]
MSGSRTGWNQLSGRQRTGIAAAACLQITLQLAALIDLHRRSRTRIRGPKRIWVGVSFLNFVGPLAYFVFGRRR